MKANPPKIQPQRLLVRTFETDLGWTGFLRDDENIVRRVKFGFRNMTDLLGELREYSTPDDPFPIDFDLGDSRFDKQLQSDLCQFAQGKPVVFLRYRIDQSWMTTFQNRVIDACRGIPFGQSLSYGELAKQSGSPRAARAVGSVMAQNRFPIIVPCHRVVASGNRLGGFSAPDGVNLKKRILLMESASTTNVETVTY